jgi:hypothetical protein
LQRSARSWTGTGARTASGAVWPCVTEVVCRCRCRVQLDSLQRVELEQKELIEKLVNNDSA